MSNVNAIELCCSHCGEPVLEFEQHTEELLFCCEGCKTVYHLLHDNDLCAYYNLDEKPGNTISGGIERKRFDYLIDQDVQNKLIDFTHASTASTSFFIPNIHCTSCVWLLENLNKLDDGILQGTVNFLKRQLTLLFDTDKTDLRSIVELLTSIGYEPDLKLEQLSERKKSTVQRNLWLKLGIAGFCFGNIMLFSFPEYLNLSTSSSENTFRIFFGALNIILALPVLLYSSSDYLKSAWAAVSQKGINLDVPISIGIVALFGRSLYEILSGTGAGYFDSFTGFIFFLLIGKLVQKKTFDRLSFDRDYRSYLPISALKLVNGLEESVTVEKLAIGDRIVLRNNELIPADSILESDMAMIDYSFITGESEPVSVKKGDQVFAGGKVCGMQAQMLVTKKVKHSYLVRLWEDNPSGLKDSKITGFADQISPYFTFAVLVIALASCIIWLQIEPAKAFNIFTAVLIVACPCALALSTPFTLGSATNILSLNGLFVKSTEVIEILSKTDTTVFDKTGTITDARNASITYHGSSLNKEELSLIKSAAQTSVHPFSKRIYNYLGNVGSLKPDSVEEITGKGIHALMDNTSLFMGNKQFVEQQTSLTINTKTSTSSQVHIAVNGSYKGYFEFENELRNGLSTLLNKLQRNYRIYLLSGDNEKDGERLHNLFGGWENMRFRQSPYQKQEFINALKTKGNHVLMLGDGLNDAGALQASSFGIAITDDTSSFSPACDAILDGEHLQDLDRHIGFSISSMNIIKASFVLSLIYNLTGLGFAITGYLSPLVAAILMPLSSVSVMVFTSVLTRIKAKQMGFKIWV